MVDFTKENDLEIVLFVLIVPLFSHLQKCLVVPEVKKRYILGAHVHGLSSIKGVIPYSNIEKHHNKSNWYKGELLWERWKFFMAYVPAPHLLW